MEKIVHKFPSIEQFRNVIHQVNHRTRYTGETEDGEPIYNNAEDILPTLTYRGSVKLHGTNAAIVWQWNPLSFEYEMQAQSRTNIITPIKDNAGFAAFAHTMNHEGLLTQIMRSYGSDLGYTPELVKVYGEWCGGNIQKGVAINGLDKMFVIFAIKIDKTWLLDEVLSQIKDTEAKVYNILDYPTYDITIDFNNPSDSAVKLGELVDIVEKECPVGKAFGVEKGVGEGLVLICTTAGWEGSKYWFKIKGEEHKSSGTKEKVPVDIERINSINELVKSFLTDSRLNQGLEHLRMNNYDMSKKSTGHYVQWISNDIVKEELDTIVGNGFDVKEITKVVSNIARKWFFDKLDKEVGI
jgi:hypothetical protein